MERDVFSSFGAHFLSRVYFAFTPLDVGETVHRSLPQIYNVYQSNGELIKTFRR